MNTADTDSCANIDCMDEPFCKWIGNRIQLF